MPRGGQIGSLPEWLKGAIDAPDPYALMAGVVSEEDFAEISADGWLEMAGVREVITEAYWAKVGPLA